MSLLTGIANPINSEFDRSTMARKLPTNRKDNQYPA